MIKILLQNNFQAFVFFYYSRFDFTHKTELANFEYIGRFKTDCAL